MTLLLAVLSAVALVSVQPGVRPPGAGAPGGAPAKPEPVPVSAAQVFRDLRDSIQLEPIAERLTVTVRQPEQTPVSANIVLRIAPGRDRDLRDARVAIEAGSLKVYARGGTADAPGELTVVSAGNASAYFRVPLEGPPELKVLSDALLPLPLPTLAFCFAPGDKPVADPTPLTRGITWQGTTANINEPTAPITLIGALAGRPDHPATLVLEYHQKRLRMKSFTAPLSGSGAAVRTLQINAVPIDPGDPAGWVIDVSNRTRVASISMLGVRLPASEPSTAPTQPEKPSDPAGESPKTPEAPAKEEPKPAAPPPAKRGPEP